ncbi:MAG: acetyl-CoA carboxylase biotin carboxyl carrier protein [Clostridiales bacterium]|nr:acetyl-CoA carboxylase biotin carboxyl carrier protein [Clostridiales bacterium]
MNIERIKAIADIFEEKGLTCLEVTEGASSIRLEKKVPSPTTPPQAAPETAPPPSQGVAQASPPCPDDQSLRTVAAPLAGIYYAAPSPESAPFVQVGARVKKGDILCIIEAMKVMNELVSDYDGEIAEICVENGQIVEFNQPIIKIRQ